MLQRKTCLLRNALLLCAWPFFLSLAAVVGIKKYFTSNELKSLDEEYDPAFRPEATLAVAMQGAGFFWDDDHKYLALDDITFGARRGELSMIVGRVNKRKPTPGRPQYCRNPNFPHQKKWTVQKFNLAV